MNAFSLDLYISPTLKCITALYFHPFVFHNKSLKMSKEQKFKAQLLSQSTLSFKAVETN